MPRHEDTSAPARPARPANGARAVIADPYGCTRPAVYDAALDAWMVEDIDFDGQPMRAGYPRAAITFEAAGGKQGRGS